MQSLRTPAIILVILGLIAAVAWLSMKFEEPVRPLIVYAAPAVRVPLERIAGDYEAETGRKVEMRFGPSETILTQVGMTSPAAPADLFLPADSSYVETARDRRLVSEAFPIATMKVVVLTAPGNPKRIARWNDLLRDGMKVALPNPGAAVGKVARDHLTKTGKWNALAANVVDTGTVTEAANAAKLGAVDAAIVWDAVAGGYKDQTVLKLPEFEGASARVDLAILKQSSDPVWAKRLADFIIGEKGIQRFREAGFDVVERNTP
jgi:molybdenum ABC transporter molybdate-binding protein